MTLAAGTVSVLTRSFLCLVLVEWAKRIIGTNDLAIGAITLSVKGIMVTRNTIDFQRIPGLVLEDWTAS